jgi:ADP-ribose pyrophosphatase YjhB (NUDIX family)
MRPVTERWARFGPADRKWFIHVPRGGVCLSAFLIVRNLRGDVLLGRPRPHAAWAAHGCLPPFRVREIRQRGEWILPSSHLLMEEAPSQAADRIRRQWAGLRQGRPRLIAIDSSRMGPGQHIGSGRNRWTIHHWAIGFVYEVRSKEPPPAAPWWEETKFFPLAKLRSTRVGRAHKDLIRYLTTRPLVGR